MTPRSMLTRVEQNLNTAFMLFNNSIRRDDPDLPYLFVEGYDRDYYEVVIKPLNKSTFSPVFVPCHGKKNVIKMHQKLSTNSSYDSLHLLYFVDKDYDDNSSLSTDIFVTCGYSVENYYCGSDVIEAFLNTFCHLNRNDHADQFQSVHADYDQYLNRFVDVARPFCAWYMTARNRNIVNNINYKETLPEQYCTISKTDIASTGYDYNTLNADYGVTPQVTPQEYQKAYNQITHVDHIRGKFVLQFMQAYINRLNVLQLHILQTPSGLNISNRKIMMCMLSGIARTPLRLREYIRSRLA